MKLVLTKTEKDNLNKHIVEAEKHHKGAFSKEELSLVSAQFKKTLRKKKAILTESRRCKRSLKEESHSSALSWTPARPPRRALVR